MKIKFSSTTLLILALVLSSTWYFLYEKRFKVSQQTEADQSKRLVGWSGPEIQELEVNRAEGESLKLKRSGSEWLITSPVSDSADLGVVNSLLTQLTGAEIERTVEEAPQNLEPFGLQNPTLIIKVIKDANQTKEIRLGGQTQVGYSTYAKLSDSPKVLKINRSLPTSFEKSVFELRNKKLVSIPRSEIKEVEIAQSGGQFVVSKTSEEKWLLTRDGHPVDSTAWSKFLGNVSELKALAVASETADLSTYGLTAPQVILQVSSAKAEAPKEKVLISARSGKVFAKREEKPFVYELDKTVLTELNRSEADFRDLHLTSFNRELVHKIKIQKGSSQTELKKEGADWVLADSKPNEKVDLNKVEKFLGSLLSLKSSAPANIASIAKPSVVIELFETVNSNDVLVGKMEFLKVSNTEVRGKSNYLPVGWKIPASELQNIELGRENFLVEPESKPAQNKES